VAECLPSKLEPLSSNPCSTKKKKKKNRILKTQQNEQANLKMDRPEQTSHQKKPQIGHAYNPSTQMPRWENCFHIGVRGQTGLHKETLSLKKKLRLQMSSMVELSMHRPWAPSPMPQNKMRLSLIVCSLP
jgi:hypothetical protein